MGPMSTVGHAQYVLDWMPSGVPGPPCQKEYAVMETEISSLGYLQRLEGGVLEKTRPAGYRWHGPVRHEGHDQQMRFLYCICGIVSAALSVVATFRCSLSWY